MDWELIRSTWTLWIVPAAAAVAGIAFFLKTTLEVQRLKLERKRRRHPCGDVPDHGAEARQL